MDMKQLNDSQKAAVKAVDKPVLIFAGAGSGKTRVLTHKIAFLIKEDIVKAEEILAVTFTNKAASEMKMRVSKLLNYPIDRMWLGTFHSLSAKILRAHAELVGLRSNFIIIDSDDQLKLIETRPGNSEREKHKLVGLIAKAKEDARKNNKKKRKNERLRK